jgi:Tfp pilus assembly protein FimT
MCEAVPSKASVMRIMSISCHTHFDFSKDLRSDDAFSLLEMTSVVALIMIVASISAPIYHRTVVLSRETDLRDHHFTLRLLSAAAKTLAVSRATISSSLVNTTRTVTAEPDLEIMRSAGVGNRLASWSR